MERPRTKSREVAPVDASRRAMGSPGLVPNTGPLAAAAWLAARGLIPDRSHWYATITFPVLPDDGTRFSVEVFAEEWGYQFERDGKMSWIRVTDLPFVHGRDEYELLTHTPPLREIGRLLRHLEEKFAVQFAREGYRLETSISGADPAIRAWASAL